MYNKHEIMVNAWSIRKTTNVSMSTALKAAWALAKVIKTAEAVAEDIGWAKGGHNRTYIEVAVYTNAWHLKRTNKIGYVNNLTGEFVAA